MKKNRLISAFLLVVFLFSISAMAIYADNSAICWYLKKKKNSAPDFPNNTDFIDSNSGYYIDKKANKSADKVLYLTFDAGYENGNVEKILDILKEKDVPAAFFILSNLIIKNTELVKRMHDDGHLVCNHTKNHKDMTTLTEEEMEKNLLALETLYEEKTGYTMTKFFRFPEGKYSEDRLSLCHRLGYKTFFWSIAYADWDNGKQMSCDKAINKLMSQTHPGAIILLHPTSETNVKILPTLIERWRNEGYRFGSLDEITG